jgi:hypothetical protein
MIRFEEQCKERNIGRAMCDDSWKGASEVEERLTPSNPNPQCEARTSVEAEQAADKRDANLFFGRVIILVELFYALCYYVVTLLVSHEALCVSRPQPLLQLPYIVLKYNE